MRNILVVDDEPIVLRFCELAFASRGVHSISAKDGAEGLHIFTQRRDEIDLVMADVVMPGMGGTEMASRMFELKPRASIILMSGYDPEDIVSSEMQRLCTLLMKPFTVDRLFHVVGQCIADGARGALSVKQTAGR